jgi:hypothetical protein
LGVAQYRQWRNERRFPAQHPCKTKRVKTSSKHTASKTAAQFVVKAPINHAKKTPAAPPAEDQDDKEDEVDKDDEEDKARKKKQLAPERAKKAAATRKKIRRPPGRS